MYSNNLNSLLVRMYNNSSYKLDKKTVDIFELKKMLANKHIRPEGDFLYSPMTAVHMLNNFKKLIPLKEKIMFFNG